MPVTHRLNDGRGGWNCPKQGASPNLDRTNGLAEDFAEASAAILLPALVPAGRTKRVNVALDQKILDPIDSSARDPGADAVRP